MDMQDGGFDDVIFGKNPSSPVTDPDVAYVDRRLFSRDRVQSVGTLW
jgi:hypothetical protein